MNVSERLLKIVTHYENEMENNTPRSKDIGNGYSVSRTDTPCLQEYRRELRGNHYIALVQVLRDAVRLNDGVITIRCAELIEEVLKEIKEDDLSLYLNGTEMINHTAMRLMDIELNEMLNALDDDLPMFTWTNGYTASKSIDIIIYYGYLGFIQADLLRNQYSLYLKHSDSNMLVDDWIRKSRESFQRDPKVKYLLEDALLRLRGNNTSLDLIGNLDSGFYVALRKMLE